MRRTKAVMEVNNFFKQRSGPVSAVDMVNRFKGIMNKVTVYRVLARLEKEGIIHTVVDKDGLTWYARSEHSPREKLEDHHPHFQCNKCGRMLCLPVSLELPNIKNHKIESENILLIGACEDCQKEPESSEN
jgi:Fur family ferric uptake transcriptional regulator